MTIAGFEAFNTVVNDEAGVSGIVLGEGSTDIIEMYEDGEQLNNEISDLEQYIQQFEAAAAFVKGIENNVAVLEEHGISKGVMKAIDPDGIWAKHMGVENYDEFPEVPMRDDMQVQAVEAMKDTLKKWGEAIKNFFKKIWEKLKAIFSKVVQMFSRSEKVLKSLKEKIKKVSSLDDKKLKEKKVKTLKAGDFEKWSDVLGDVGGKLMQFDMSNFVKTSTKKADAAADVYKAIVGNNGKAIGVKLNDKKDGITSEKDTFDEKANSNDLKALGYNTTNVEKIIDEAIGMAAAIRGIPKLQKAWENTYKMAESVVDSLVKSGNEQTTDEKKEIENMKKAYQTASSLSTKVISACKKGVSNTISIANAVIACEKK